MGLFDEEIWSAGDFDFWLRALHAGCQIEPIEKVLAKYRRHRSSMSLGRVQPILSVIQALEKWRGRWDLTEEENEAVEFTHAEWKHSANVALAIENIHKKQYSVAAELLRQAHAHTPKWRFQVSRVGLANSAPNCAVGDSSTTPVSDDASRESAPRLRRQAFRFSHQLGANHELDIGS